MALTVYGIKNCDSMKKAFQWLEANEVAYHFVDFKKVITKHWQLMTGIVIVGVALFMPRGLAGIRFPSSADKKTNKEDHSS